MNVKLCDFLSFETRLIAHSHKLAPFTSHTLSEVATESYTVRIQRLDGTVQKISLSCIANPSTTPANRLYEISTPIRDVTRISLFPHCPSHSLTLHHYALKEGGLQAAMPLILAILQRPFTAWNTTRNKIMPKMYEAGRLSSWTYCVLQKGHAGKPQILHSFIWIRLQCWHVETSR